LNSARKRLEDYLFGKLVVRPDAPKRRAVLLGLAVLSGLAVLYMTFEFGRYEAGFRVVDSVRGALSASARIRELETENEKQRGELEAAEVARRVDREGYKQIDRTLGDMQSQIARLNQDLSFYRGLVQPDSVIHVKVQQMQIVPESTPGQYRLKFVLMQTGKPDSAVAGGAAITIDGLLQKKPASLTFEQVAPNRRHSLAYSFRYFQDYDEPIQLPQGFEPARVGVEIRSIKDKDPSHSFRQAFVWKAQGMSVETEASGAAPVKAKGDPNVQTETD
jgi:uncharacterized protein DUF6776